MEDWDADLNQAETSLKEAHHTYQQIRVVLLSLMTMPSIVITTLVLLNLNLEVTKVANNSPAKTPHLLNYKAAS